MKARHGLSALLDQINEGLIQERLQLAPFLRRYCFEHIAMRQKTRSDATVEGNRRNPSDCSVRLETL
jgi:predicted DNA-binding ribbon-helix-helix protein